MTEKEEHLTAKYRSVYSSDIVFVFLSFYHNGFVGLLFRFSVEQSKSFSILGGQPVLSRVTAVLKGLRVCYHVL